MRRLEVDVLDCCATSMISLCTTTCYGGCVTATAIARVENFFADAINNSQVRLASRSRLPISLATRISFGVVHCHWPRLISTSLQAQAILSGPSGAQAVYLFRVTVQPSRSGGPPPLSLCASPYVPLCRIPPDRSSPRSGTPLVLLVEYSTLGRFSITHLSKLRESGRWPGWT
ncbi:uncharacterized protein EI90DRAFT_1457421 [Cantharellus anzutake]|uniref:uncharacterized protein n=1 Tax=Cantharellus anzutake TaxID=1750568 RepID=UPI0019037425|nr:uncharacterized protein EI90DRAFT_1457421 [Cantharellus anzutake]KAF8329161.1 hypothetical protein EI90DRAFT_1457421 [Cantharellus anzutake]